MDGGRNKARRGDSGWGGFAVITAQTSFWSAMRRPVYVDTVSGTYLVAWETQQALFGRLCGYEDVARGNSESVWEDVRQP